MKNKLHNPFCKTFLCLRQLPEVEDKSGPQCGGDCGRQEEPAVDRTDILRETINQPSFFNGNGDVILTSSLLDVLCKG